MKQCAGDADADTPRNKTYPATVANPKGSKDGGDDAKEKLRRLVASEPAAWIAYRDAECDFEGTSMLEGTGDSLVIVDCRYTMTAARAKAISSVLDANWGSSRAA